MINKLILYILCLQIIIAPLLYGATDTYAWGSCFILTLVGFLLFSFEQVRNQHKLLLPPHIAILLFAFILSISVQFILPEETLPIPSLQNIEESDTLLVGKTFQYSYSMLNLKQSYYQWLWIVMSFVLVVYITKSRKEIKILFACLVFISCVEAIISFIQYFYPVSNPIHFYMANHPGAFSGATGTFIGRNSCACMLAMSIPILLAQSMYLSQKRKSKNKKHNTPTNKYTEQSIRYTILTLVLVSVILAVFAVFFTLSRTGIILFFFALMFFMLLYLRSKNKKYFVIALLVISILIFVFVVVAYLFLGVENRFENIQQDLSYRLFIYQVTYEIIQDHFWFGCGGGNFYYAMELYRRPPITLEYWYCENDYLQFLAEYGIISTLVLIVLLLCILKIILGQETSKTRFSYGLWCGCTVSLLILSLFALFHFPLQVPFFKLYAVYIMAIALSMKVKSSSAWR